MRAWSIIAWLISNPTTSISRCARATSCTQPPGPQAASSTRWIPERSNDFSGIQRVLDAACGPGGWVQEVALAHREIEVVGFDISQAMIDHARMQAQVHSLDNARFMVMNLLQ